MKQLQNNVLYDADVKTMKQSEYCTVYEMKNNEGAGVITSYQVFPGIQLAYNDFHMGKCPHHEVKYGYFKLKILELLLFLSILDPFET